jgi:hypothetical protein
MPLRGDGVDTGEADADPKFPAEHVRHASSLPAAISQHQGAVPASEWTSRLRSGFTLLVHFESSPDTAEQAEVEAMEDFLG